MHYGVLVLIDTPDTITKESVESAVESAIEHYGDGDKWDWYQVGGRWTGTLDGYDPDTDPRNIVTCDLCGGTGDRATFRHEPKDNQHPSGCNGCNGTGQRTTWPTDWGFHAGDVKPTRELTADDLAKFYAVAIAEYGWFGGETWEPWNKAFVAQPKPPLDYLVAEHGDKLAVVVDCHN